MKCEHCAPTPTIAIQKRAQKIEGVVNSLFPQALTTLDRRLKGRKKGRREWLSLKMTLALLVLPFCGSLANEGSHSFLLISLRRNERRKR
jgi:hypothetical protein